MNRRHVALGAVLTALALVIPLYFGFLRVIIPPFFTATLASHVPSMLAMFISPVVAGAVGAGSALGFFVVLGPVIGLRASIHVIFGVLGAILYQRGMKPWLVLVLMLPVHALGEALVVWPFVPTLRDAFLITGVGTALHHVMDSFITLAVFGIVVKFLGERAFGAAGTTKGPAG